MAEPAALANCDIVLLLVVNGEQVDQVLFGEQGLAGRLTPGSLVIQLLVGVHIATAAEAMALGIRMGLDPESIYEVITNSAGNDLPEAGDDPQGSAPGGGA